MTLLRHAVTAAAIFSSFGDSKYTQKHEAGRCAMRGSCGKAGFFGPELPCVDNEPATAPDAELREQLVSLCGPKWQTGDVCCNLDQVKTMKDNFGTASQLIASCPACKENFYNMFCTFTCSPDQSLFVNITQATEKNEKLLVTELDQLVSEEYGTGFYDSCKDVKFGPTNSRAMDLIGGGAKNYTQFLTFLGKKRLGGSPFQMNFPTEYSEPEMSPQTKGAKKCNDEDPDFRCACTDCPAVCPKPPELKENAGQVCMIGALPCLSFWVILIYGLLVFGVVSFKVGKTWWQRRQNANLFHDDTHIGEDEPLMGQQNGYRDEKPVRPYKVNEVCDRAFYNLGHACARSPILTIIISLAVVTILGSGLHRFKDQLETDPARLWVSPSSAAAQEKEFFDANFGPFYRAEKIFLVNDTQPGGPGPVLSSDTLRWWMDVEKSVRNLKGPEHGTTLDQVCFKPTGSACVVQSVAAYFENEPSMVDKHWRDTLTNCAKQPVNCRPEYGQPLDPDMILGGYTDIDQIADAPAMTVTWVVRNAPEGSDEVKLAMDWETAMKNRLLELQDEAADRGLRLSFSTEISLEEELNKSTNTDAKIIVISYLIMFLYASIALGSTTISWSEVYNLKKRVLVKSKFGLGLSGIIVVLLSIVASAGFFSWVGLKATLIIVDVIPFIVLAVGVDNIFLIIHEYERINQEYTDDGNEVKVARALGRMGPSILFSAITETLAFALGAFVGMPAVRNFAIYAAGAVFINAILQVTLFVSILTLDQYRIDANRMDLIFIKLSGVRLTDRSIRESRSGARRPEIEERETQLQKFIRKVYAPKILGSKTKKVIVVAFTALFTAGIALLPETKLGLDQRVAIPDGSYLIPYFNDLYDYFNAGPPVYFVTKEANATTLAVQKELCSRFPACDTMSLPGMLELERQRANVSHIATPTASWIDDFLMWLNPDFDQCCVENGRPCLEGRDWNVHLDGMPTGPEFLKYLQKFLDAETTDDCPLAGKASYGDAVVIDTDKETVLASNFRTSHAPLRSQEDFIEAYASARRIASDITQSTGIEVFPYSVFYIFFDQYATIIGLTAALLGAAVAIIFIVAVGLLGSFQTAAVVALTVIMTITDIIGAMAVMDVSLNAVSLVNLIICVGIAVEFCAHIARAFTFPSTSNLETAASRINGSTKDYRAWAALVNVGGSVFSGITLTKFVGVSVLAFTRSKIFEVYYFRVWVALVVFAALHALVFLPVALSYLGGRMYLDPESKGSMSDNLRQRRNRLLNGGYASDESE